MQLVKLPKPISHREFPVKAKLEPSSALCKLFWVARHTHP